MQDNAVPTRNLLIKRPACTHEEELVVAKLYDRRSPAWDEVEWLMQADLEWMLFSNPETKGAFYRLLCRSAGYGVALRGSLSLRRSSIDSGLITAQEWDKLKSLTHAGMRIMTLVPLETACAAILTYGESEVSISLLTALEALPDDWKPLVDDEEAVSSEQGAEGEEAETGEEDESDDEDEGEGGGGGGGDDEGSGEGEDEREGEGGGDENGNGEGGDTDSVPDTEPEDNEEGESTANAEYDVPTEKCMMTPALAREFEAFGRFRAAPLNVHRGGAACTARTTELDTAQLMQLFSWLEARGVSISFGGIFSSTTIASTIQTFLKDCRDRGVKWATCSRRMSSYISAAKFVHEVRLAQAKGGVSVPTTAVDQLARLHTQCKRSARQESMFALAKKPEQWLSWEDVQRARVKARCALEAYAGKSASKLQQLTRDVCLLTILSLQPPDR